MEIIDGFLRVKGNSLKSFAEIEELEDSDNLKIINLIQTNIKDIIFPNLPNLKILAIYEAPITRIEGFEKIPNLGELRIGTTLLTEIKGLNFLQDLSTLYLSGNRFLENIDFQGVNNLRYLDISHNNKLNADCLKYLNNLEELWYIDANLKNLTSIIHLTNLKILNLSYNLDLDLNSISNFRNLEYLSLNGCNLTDISFLEGLPQLKSLYISENQINSLNSILKLKNLVVLNISNNEIDDLKKLETLDSLQTIRLNGNKFTGYDELMSHIGSAVQLKEYCLRKSRGNLGYLDYYKPEISLIDNLSNMREQLKQLKDSEIIDIGTHLEYNPYRSIQDFIFLENPIRVRNISKIITAQKEIIFHLIQLHSLKGIKTIKTDEFDKNRHFKIFVSHFWDDVLIDSEAVLRYKESNKSIKNKIKEILSLSLFDCRGRPDVIVFPENSIPYSSLKFLIKFSKINGLILIGGLEHKKYDETYKNLAFIIDNGLCRFQEKQTPVSIKLGQENIECRKIPRIKIFKTSIGRIAIFICKDFLRLSDIIPIWTNKNDVDFVIVPSLSHNVLPFHYNVFNLLNYSKNKNLTVIFNNVGEYGGSEMFSIERNKKIEEKFRTNKRDNVGEVIVIRKIRNWHYKNRFKLKRYPRGFQVISTT